VTKVVLPTHLRSYTNSVAEVEVTGDTLDAALWDLEARYPGLRVRIIDEQDRIRPHIKCFVAGEQAKQLSVAITGDVHILAALSGG
jgi:molybdopterin synthase sulfur carrier subunit